VLLAVVTVPCLNLVYPSIFVGGVSIRFVSLTRHSENQQSIRRMECSGRHPAPSGAGAPDR
jgi:hypothetical protein